MKRFCLVAYTDYSSDARVMRHAEAASQAGYAVDVITPINGSKRRTKAIDSVMVYRLRAKHYDGSMKALYILGYLNFFICCFFWLTWKHLIRGYDVIQVCNMPDFLVFSALIAKLGGAKVILDIHDPTPETFLSKFPGSRSMLFYSFILLQERLSAAFSDKVITVHEPVKNDILIQAGVEEKKISVITNFPDDNIFKPCKQFNIRFPIRMIYYGTIAPRFGLQEALSAIAHMKYRDQIIMKIIGKGEDEFALRTCIKALGLEKLVDFENKVFPLRELPNIICQFHLGIVPYSPCYATDYMLPVKMLELLAMGIPPVSITNKAIRYYVDECLYFAYDSNDMSSLTCLLDGIIKNPSIIVSKRDSILKSEKKLLWKDERPKYLDILARLST
jgi:glycosyltransferase involved in cell wall biosynthesis